MGNNLKYLRENKKLSQDKLAEAIGVSRQMISYFEKGLRVPNANMIIAISKALDCTPNDILGYDDGKE